MPLPVEGYGDPLVVEDSSGLDFRQLLGIVVANLPLIGIIVAVSLAGALVLTMLTTPRYTASTSLQISDQTAQVMGKGADEDGNDAQVSSMQDTERFLQTQLEIMNSRALAERVAQRLNLVGNPAFYAAMGKHMPTDDPSRRELEEDAIKILQKAEEGTLPRNSRLASINFTATDPAFAARVANTWANEFIQANLQRRYDSSAYARDFISGQLAEAKAKLTRSEKDLNAYARSAGLIKTRDASAATTTSGSSDAAPNSVTAASLLQLNYAANLAEQTRIAAEERWHAVAGANLMSSPEVLSNPAMSALTAERAHDDADLQRERARHLDDYPAVLQLKAQQVSINHQIDEVARNIRNSIKQQYEAAVEAENKLKGQVNDLKGSSLAEQDRSVQYNLLARDSDTNRSLYESLLQRYKQLTAAAGISASNISIIDSADVPIEPSSPKLLVNMGLALFVGVVLSIVVVTIRHQIDDTVRVPEDVENKLGMPLLGIIPFAVDGMPNVALQDPKSAISEAYNSLRSQLLFSTSEGLPKTLLITSSQPSEGKSTTSIATSQGVAKLGRRVVLVDVDMRRPSLHAVFGLDNKRGLSTLLTQQDSIDDVLRDSPIENLSIITSGPIPPSPTDLLSSVHMSRILEELGKRFDMVVLDSPPVLGLADAPLLATLADGVLLIVQSERSRRGSLKSSVRRLQTIRSNMLGAVLTMFDPSKGGNRYSEYYGYDYYQYAYKKEQ